MHKQRRNRNRVACKRRVEVVFHDLVAISDVLAFWVKPHVELHDSVKQKDDDGPAWVVRVEVDRCKCDFDGNEPEADDWNENVQEIPEEQFLRNEERNSLKFVTALPVFVNRKWLN